MEQALTAEAEPTKAEIDRALAENPRRFDQPTRWQLQNIWRARPADPDARARVESEMSALRARLGAGADFASAARAESESQTRLRGGKMGWARLDRLRPEIAATVATMKAGDLSPVIEQEDGWTILQCTAVRPGHEVRGDDARARLRGRLADGRLRALRDTVEEEALARLGGQVLSATLRGTEPTEPVVRFADGSTASRRDVHFFFRDRNKPLEGLSGPRANQWIDEFLLAEARAREARRRGLLESAEYQRNLAAETRKLQVEWVLEPALRQAAEQVTEAAVEARFHQQADQFVAPEQILVRRLVLSIGPGAQRDEIERFVRAAEQAAVAEGAPKASRLDALRARLADIATELEEPGWMPASSGFGFGRLIAETLPKLEPGEISGPLQEGRDLSVIELVDRRAERPLTFAEAAPRIRSALERRRRESRRRVLRQQIAAELDIQLVEHDS